MGKRIFWIFIAFILLVTSAAIFYVQSESFARLAKAEIQKAVQKDLGLELNFDRLRIGVLPPSLSLTNVNLTVLKKENVLDLSTDTIIKAERLGFSFRMIQAFSRGISVNKVFLQDGEIVLQVPKSKNTSPREKISELVHKPIKISLGDGFSVNIRQFEVKNIKTKISWMAGSETEFFKSENIGYLAVTPSSQGTNVVGNIDGIQFKIGKISQELKAFRVNADLKKNGVLLSNLDVERKSLALHSSGQLLGSIDDPENFRMDAALILRGPMQEFGEFESSLGKFSGELLADIHLGGKISEPQVSGKMEVGNFVHSLWSIEKLSLVGSYLGKQLVINSLEAQNHGGQISLEEKVDLAIPIRSESKMVKLKLKNARFEDFAGDLKRDVNNLRMLMNGKIEARLELAGAPKVAVASVVVKPDLDVVGLELNNQSFGKVRPYKEIFKIQPLKLVGSVQWRPGEIKVSDSRLILGTGTVDVKGTVTDAKGFDLVGSSPSIDIGKEVGMISGIAVVGQGAAKITVVGPTDRVLLHFDLDQKNAKFLKFDFGSIVGRITYDEHNDYIYIAGVNGKKGVSSYSIDGKVDVGEGDSLDLNATFRESDPNDIFDIFAKQIEHISWIPHGMLGVLDGTAKVGGGYNKGLESLKIKAQVKGKNLSYLGESLQEVKVETDLDNSLMRARIIEGRKYETPISGQIQYHLNGDMKYSFSAHDGKLRSIDYLGTRIPADGIFSLDSKGEGKWETLRSSTTFSVKNTFVRTRAVPNLNLSLETYADRSEFTGKLGDGVQFRAKMARQNKSASDAELSIAGADFDHFLCAINRKVCTDSSLGFLVGLNLKANWLGESWEKMNGQGEITNLNLAKTGFNLRSSNKAPLSIRDGFFETAPLELEGEKEKMSLRMRAKVDGSYIRGELAGASSLRLLEFLTPLVEEARGKMEMSIGLDGSVSAANFHGKLGIKSGFLRLSGLDAPVENLSGNLRLAGSKVQLDGVNGQLGGGSAQASGSVDIFLNKPPRFDLDLFLANNRVKFFPVSFAEVADGKLSFTGDKPPYLFSGAVKMKRVMMRNNFDMGNAKKGAQNARYLPEKLGGAKYFYETRIRAYADDGVFVENNLLNAEFKGEVTLLNNFEFPQLVARAELVRGKLLFRNNAFILDYAYIRAPNQEYFNPQFSIGGTANVDNYRISLFAAGTTERNKITFSSYPALPQEDIVSLLAFGYKGEDARRLNPNDTSAITYSEVGSILLEQLQLNQNLQSKGLRVYVAPSFNESEASIIRPDSSQTAAPKVYLQTQIVKNLDAAFGGTVGSTAGQSLDAKLEYRLGRKASVSAVYEQSPAGLDTTEIKNSYGGDLKFRWGFQ